MFKWLNVTILFAIVFFVGCANPPSEQPSSVPPTQAAQSQPTQAAQAQPTQVQPTKPQEPKQVVIIQGVDITSMDPHNESSLVARQVYFHLFDTLIQVDAQSQPRPGLAESWKYVDDLTVEFKLRKNVTFTNGEPFNAAAVKFSLERINDPKLKGVWKAMVSHVAEITIVDDYTVRVKSKTPWVPGLSDVGRMFMLPPKYIQEVGNDKFNLLPIGSGAYKFVERIAGDRIVLEANANYWGGKPKIDRLVFRTVPEDLARVTELVTGRADIITEVSPEMMKKINDSGVAKAVAIDGARNIQVYLSQGTPPLGDVKIRQAMNYAVNRDALIKDILGGYATPVAGPLGRFAVGYDPAIPGYTYDPEKAKRLLAEAGMPSGFDVTFRYAPGRFMKDEEVAQAIAGQLGKVGIRVKLDRQEWGVYWANFTSGKLDSMDLLSMGAGADPDVQLKYFHKPRFGFYFNTPELNTLLDKMVTTTSDAERLKVLSQTQKYLIDQAGWIFLFDLKNIYGVSNRLKWVPWPSEYIWLHNAEVQ